MKSTVNVTTSGTGTVVVATVVLGTGGIVVGGVAAGLSVFVVTAAGRVVVALAVPVPVPVEGGATVVAALVSIELEALTVLSDVSILASVVPEVTAKVIPVVIPVVEPVELVGSVSLAALLTLADVVEVTDATRLVVLVGFGMLVCTDPPQPVNAVRIMIASNAPTFVPTLRFRRCLFLERIKISSPEYCRGRISAERISHCCSPSLPPKDN